MQHDLRQFWPIREYDAVDLSIVWDTIHNNLPLLIDQLDEIFHP